jgi:hypothetical protein
MVEAGKLEGGRTSILPVVESRLENFPGSGKVHEVELGVQGEEDLERVVGHCRFLMRTHLVDVWWSIDDSLCCFEGRWGELRITLESSGMCEVGRLLASYVQPSTASLRFAVRLVLFIDPSKICWI